MTSPDCPDCEGTLRVEYVIGDQSHWRDCEACSHSGYLEDLCADETMRNRTLARLVSALSER